MRKALPVLLLLAAAELISYGPFIAHRGFCADDWIFLYNSLHAGGLAGAVRNLAAGGFWARPAEILEYPLLYAGGLSHPALDQAFLLLLKIVEGGLLFLLLERLLEWRALAFAAAALALTYPDRSATHLWYANAPQSLCLVLTLVSLLLHESWIRTRRSGELAAGLACYLLGLLSYESAAFAPLILGAGLAARGIASGRPARKALVSAARDLLPYAAALGAGLLWMWGGAALLSGQSNPKPLQLSLSAAAAVYWSAALAMTRDTVLLCAKAAPLAAAHLSRPLMLAAGALFAAAVFRPREEPAPAAAPRRKSLTVAAALGAAAILAGYAPYGFSRHPYLPDVLGIMNRINAVGAWGAGILLAAALAALFPRRALARRAALVLLLAAFAWTNAVMCLQWALSWQTQRGILAGVAPPARALPPGSLVVLAGAPERFGGAPVFTESWDFDDALKLATGRDDLRGRVAGPRMSFAPDAVVESPDAAHWPRAEDWRYPYRNIYLYRADRGTLERLDGPPASARRPITATWYAAPVESDFGARATEPAEWRLEGSREAHRSLFAPGFASRDADDPEHPGISGAGMEGGGWLSPELHRNDAALSAALAAGYRVLTLERWDPARRKAEFSLTRAPVGADGAPLVAGVSAAVRRGDKLFPRGRWVRLYKDGAPAGERLIHDDCSSCETDAHIDLFQDLDAPVPDGRWEAELLPAGFVPENRRGP